jgi:hypothetical protein
MDKLRHRLRWDSVARGVKLVVSVVNALAQLIAVLRRIQ